MRFKCRSSDALGSAVTYHTIVLAVVTVIAGIVLAVTFTGLVQRSIASMDSEMEARTRDPPPSLPLGCASKRGSVPSDDWRWRHRRSSRGLDVPDNQTKSPDTERVSA